MYSSLAICIFIFVFGNIYSAAKPVNKPASPKVVNINDFFDEHLSDFRPLIKQFRFDPMSIPNITEDVGFHLEMWSGIMFGASNLTRGGDISITFYDNFWRMEATVFIEELKCKFNYSAKVWFFPEQKGRMNVTVKDVTVNLGVDLSIPNFIISNPKVHVKDYGDVNIERHADSIIDVAGDIGINSALPFFKENIINRTESTALEVASVTVKMVNDYVKQTISNVDQYVGSLLRQLHYTLMGNTKPQDIDKVLSPYLKNPTNLSPEDNPFRDLDKWIASLWDETVLVWNNTSGAQATQFQQLDKWLASLIPTRLPGPRPTAYPMQAKNPSEWDQWWDKLGQKYGK